MQGITDWLMRAGSCYQQVNGIQMAAEVDIRIQYELDHSISTLGCADVKEGQCGTEYAIISWSSRV